MEPYDHDAPIPEIIVRESEAIVRFLWRHDPWLEDWLGGDGRFRDLIPEMIPQMTAGQERTTMKVAERAFQAEDNSILTGSEVIVMMALEWMTHELGIADPARQLRSLTREVQSHADGVWTEIIRVNYEPTPPDRGPGWLGFG